MNKIKIILGITVILLTIFISEFLYYLNHKQSLEINDYLKKAQIYSKFYMPKKTLEHFINAAQFRLIGENNAYPPLQNDNIPTLQLTLSSNLKKSYRQLFSTTDFLSFDQLSSAKWGQYFYQLGLLAYQNNQDSLIVPLWQTAIHLGPLWSHFHIELANYYLSKQQPQLAQDRLNLCMQFEDPRGTCQEFLETNVIPNTPEPIGFLNTAIQEEIY